MVNIMYRTSKKETIVNYFKENADKIVSSKSLVIYFDGVINRATIFRQLKSLEIEGIIRKNYNDIKKEYEYQLSHDCENHLHLKCENCGQIIHLSCDIADVFVNHIYKEHGFSVNKKSTIIMGLCDNCSTKLANE